MLNQLQRPNPVNILTDGPAYTLTHTLPPRILTLPHRAASSAVRRAAAMGGVDTCLYAVRVSSDPSSPSSPPANSAGIATLRTYADYSSGGCAPPADRVISGPSAADVLATRILTVDVPRYHYCQGQPSGCECRSVPHI